MEGFYMNISFARQYENYLKIWEPLNGQINANIEKNRKTDGRLCLVDDDGRPVSGAKIEIKQKKHAFRFGCNILNLGQLGEDNNRYEQAFARLFNLATTTFCWRDIEPQPGNLRFTEGSPEIFRRPPPDRVVQFGRKYGIELKGQPLLADSWHPQWANGTVDEIKKLYAGYFAKVAERYGHDFAIWDVVNEAFFADKRHPEFPLFSSDLSFVEWAFREARRSFPLDGGLLEINEGGHVNLGPLADRYHALVSRLISANVGLQSVGIQFHLTSGKDTIAHLEGKAYPPDEILANYLRFSELGLPLYITEITIASRFSGLDRTEEEQDSGREIQAQIIRNLYRLWFSVPEMAGIIYWNFRDGLAWKSEGDCQGCLLSENYEKKPSYQVLDQLINYEWHTNLSLQTDADGCVDFYGFYGEYEILVHNGQQTTEYQIRLEKHQDNRYVLRLKT
jgi:GH35 family endo-1,4-beta-xylanase